MKYIVILSIVGGAFILYMLSNASVTTSASGVYYELLVTLNIAFAILLFILIVIQVFGLYQKARKKVIGIRFTLRLLISFGLMAVVPGFIVYLVSVNFITKSIDSWFNVKVEAALEGGVNLGQSALVTLLNETRIKAESMSMQLAGQPLGTQHLLLDELRDRNNLHEANLLTAQGRILSVSSGSMASFLPDLPSRQELQDAQYHTVSSIHTIDQKGLYLRVLVPIMSQEISGERYILQLLQPVPKLLQNKMEQVESVYGDYKKLSFMRHSLRNVFALSLTLVMMFATLVAVAIAFVLSKRMAQPLTVLSEGTKAIASGNYNTILPEHSKDELGVLVKSFNSMTRQLNEANHAAELNRLKVDEARGYLATILAYLSSGVIALDGEGRLRTFNQTAIQMLGLDLGPYIGYDLSVMMKEQPQLAMFFAGIIDKRQQADQLTIKDDEQIQIELMGPKGKQVITLRGTRLPDKGYVAVFEDATTMIQVQRDAAWGEVARRLAHEIKNPLTPIQLSAERLTHKLNDKLDEADAKILNRSISTIVNQVDAMKKMVNEFSEYARSPAPKLVPLDLNLLVNEVVALYESDVQKDGAQKIKIAQSSVPSMILGDTTMLRQVIHNLLQNAQDAKSPAQPLAIEINTVVEKSSVVLTVKDNGTGFPDDMLSRAFEPYMTTKTHGTGLGLAIVKKIVEEHKGTIQIDNLKDSQDQTIQGAILKLTFAHVATTK